MIDRFRAPYGFLSNFYSAPVFMYGDPYPSVEHAYQAAKCARVEDREFIRTQCTASQAKRVVRTMQLRPDWKERRLWVMEELLRRKFVPGSEMAKKLLDTYPEELVEGNDWKEMYWGVYQGYGHNHLGKLLMKIRAELRAALPPPLPIDTRPRTPLSDPTIGQGTRSRASTSSAACERDYPRSA